MLNLFPFLLCHQAGLSFSAPLRGGRLNIPSTVQLPRLFQSTPPRGGRLARAFKGIADNGFNPRPRAGGDFVNHYGTDANLAFQSTPPRGGRLTLSEMIVSSSTVSIHAPARGATSRDGGGRALRHTFQSTPPRGGRLVPQYEPVMRLLVSIHAPARGATRSTCGG